MLRRRFSGEDGPKMALVATQNGRDAHIDLCGPLLPALQCQVLAGIHAHVAWKVEGDAKGSSPEVALVV